MPNPPDLFLVEPDRKSDVLPYYVAEPRGMTEFIHAVMMLVIGSIGILLILGTVYLTFLLLTDMAALNRLTGVVGNPIVCFFSYVCVGIGFAPFIHRQRRRELQAALDENVPLVPGVVRWSARLQSYITHRYSLHIDYAFTSPTSGKRIEGSFNVEERTHRSRPVPAAGTPLLILYASDRIHTPL